MISDDACLAAAVVLPSTMCALPDNPLAMPDSSPPDCRPTAGRRHRRRLAWLLGVAAVALALAASATPILRALGHFLVVEVPLEPAPAIVVLGGGTPYREVEGAAVYRAGWAPKVLLLRAHQDRGLTAAREYGVAVPFEWEVRRDLLERLGVPANAIEISDQEVEDTLDELQAAAAILRPGSEPVILVTSPYHTRRVEWTWSYVTSGRSRPIVRAAWEDPYDPDAWWLQARWSRAVSMEYLGLVNATLGFPVRAR